LPFSVSEIKANISQYETDDEEEEEEMEETEPNTRNKKRLNPYRFFQAWTNLNLLFRHQSKMSSSKRN
jgi:hypothetical protein